MPSTQGKAHGNNEALEVAGRELDVWDLPKVSIEEDPAAWYAFAQRCFLDGRGDLARSIRIYIYIYIYIYIFIHFMD